jgi:alginate O-acetyltransferase complex protein AlgJ
VLLLGDSFTNIFSMEGMGWGAAAGLGPQLALALGRPLDVIAQNDSGAFATRQALSRELEAGQDRLAGKRVVIWEFASRELAVGDWKPISFAKPAAAEEK